MKKVALFINSPYLGGAERSIIHQIALIKNKIDVTFYLPKLSNYKKGDDQILINFILTLFPNARILHISYPIDLYEVSRSGKTNILSSILLLIKMILVDVKINLSDYDLIWVNGNKIGLPIILRALFTLYKGSFIWHFRDYPTKSGLLSKIWKIFNLKKTFKLILVSNSNSVQDAVNQYITNKKVSSFTVYNPTGDLELTPKSFDKSNITLSIVSMIAPWKGIHNIILWASIYERDLKELGVTSLKIYGAPIYQTSGEHNNYHQEILELAKKLDSNLISFCGLKPPEDIYNEIDILIHPSIAPEPFGRIIIEGWKAKKVVLSTGLGGSGELVKEGVTGYIFSPNNHEQLFKKVKHVIVNDKERENIIKNSTLRLDEIQNMIQNELNKLIDNI